MRDGGPPTFAWDWLARQRLPWQEVRRRLVADGGTSIAARYGASDARPEVMGLLREDYPGDELVRTTLESVLVQLVFLGRVDVALSERGVVAPPRGLLWWQEHLAATVGTRSSGIRTTGAAPSGPTPATAVPTAPGPRTPAPPRRSEQLALALDEVRAGYGDPTGPSGPDGSTFGSEPFGPTRPIDGSGAGHEEGGTEAVA